ncbi:MAG: hypothetical protein KA752_05365 [Giesbergeria sp.]|nr:hypothetical protein [Giesbergeria sp.]
MGQRGKAKRNKGRQQSNKAMGKSVILRSRKRPARKRKFHAPALWITLLTSFGQTRGWVLPECAEKSTHNSDCLEKINHFNGLREFLMEFKPALSLLRSNRKPLRILCTSCIFGRLVKAF